MPPTVNFALGKSFGDLTMITSTINNVKKLKVSLPSLSDFLMKRKIGRDENISVTKTFHSGKNDMNTNKIRIHNSLIISDNNPNGIVRSDDLVTVYNLDTDKFTSGYALGNGDRYPFRGRDYIAVDYRQRRFLGLTDKATKGNLEMWPATKSQIKFFHRNHHADSAFREIHKLSSTSDLFGYAIGIAGLVGISDWAFKIF